MTQWFKIGLIALLVLSLSACTVQTTSVTPAATQRTEVPQTTANTSMTTSAQDMVEGSEFIFGTLIQVRLFEGGSEALLQAAMDHLRNLENRWSVNISTSEISQINANAGIAPVVVSEDTLEMIVRGLYYAERSKGRFDISILPLVTLWGIGTDRAEVPTPEAIEENLALIGFEQVEVQADTKSVFLPNVGMGIDLGAIAKGVAADSVVAMLKAGGVKRGIVNLGGNVIVIGDKTDGTPWRIGIQNPMNMRGEYIGIAAVADKTVVTSGVYERYFEADGKRYHHILNTETGYPVENGLASVSIIAETSADADALSTAAFASGLQEGLALIESVPGVEALFITEDNKLYGTSGLKDIFTLTDDTFHWAD